MCLELLEFLNTLGAGQCKMRGLLLYEFFCCRRENQTRNIKREKNSEYDLKVCLFTKCVRFIFLECLFICAGFWIGGIYLATRNVFSIFYFLNLYESTQII